VVSNIASGKITLRLYRAASVLCSSEKSGNGIFGRRRRNTVWFQISPPANYSAAVSRNISAVQLRKKWKRNMLAVGHNLQTNDMKAKNQENLLAHSLNGIKFTSLICRNIPTHQTYYHRGNDACKHIGGREKYMKI
jgi:hypothetical protein